MHATGFVTTDDAVRLWYESRGTGAPAVLCHGGPGLWDYLAPLAALIDDRTTVTRYDQRGAGRSDPVGPFTVARSVADLEAVRAHVGADEWIVGGHSWGASLALAYALAHPRRTRAVVYVSGVGIGQAWHAAFHAEADRRRSPAQRAHLAALTANDARTAAEELEWRTLTWAVDFADPDPARASALAAQLAPEPYAINREANRAIAGEMRAWDESAMQSAVATITAPVLVIHGVVDPRPHWAVDSLVAALPNVEVHKLDGAGHSPWLEQPDRVRAILNAFLDRFSDGGEARVTHA